MGVGVDKAGQYAGSGGVNNLVSALASGAHRDHRFVFYDQRGVFYEAQRAVAERRVVGDQLADVVNNHAHEVTSCVAAANSAATFILA